MKPKYTCKRCKDQGHYLTGRPNRRVQFYCECAKGVLLHDDAMRQTAHRPDPEIALFEFWDEKLSGMTGEEAMAELAKLQSKLAKPWKETS
jgi:hypothetical protein